MYFYPNNQHNHHVLDYGMFGEDQNQLPEFDIFQNDVNKQFHQHFPGTNTFANTIPQRPDLIIYSNHLNNNTLQTVDSNASVKKPSKDRHKHSRKRLDQVNAASKRCRQRQKEELQYLRVRVKELEKELEDIKNGVTTAPETKQQDTQKNTQSELESILSKVQKTESLMTNVSSEESDASLELSTLMGVLSQLPQDFPLSFPVVPPTLPTQKYQEILPLLQYIQSQANVSKEQIHSHFTQAQTIENRGYSVKMCMTTDSISYLMTKFYINIQIEDLQNQFFRHACETMHLQENTLYKHIHAISDDVRLIDARKIGEWTLLAYGKAEIAIRLLISKWKDGDDFMFSMNSVDLPELSVGDVDCLQWSCNGWIQMRPHVENGISGVQVVRHATFGYSDGKNANYRLNAKCFADYMSSTMFSLLEEFDNSIVGIVRDAEQSSHSPTFTSQN